MNGLDADDLGWFAPVDLEFLFEALGKLEDPARVVLVGGQALAFWVDHYQLAPPPTETPYLTQDADFLGLRSEAEYLARLLDAEIRVAGFDDITANTAVLQFRGPSGARLLVDFLSALIGLDTNEVRRLSVPFTRDTATLRVMHPLLCLESRFHNLRVLRAKRTANGLAQARVAISVAAAYLDELLRAGEWRLAYDAANRLGRLAQSKSGRFVYAEYGYDPLEVVQPERFPNEQFRTRSWPAALEKARRQRRSTPPGSVASSPPSA